MEHRRLGQSGLKVSTLCLGAMMVRQAHGQIAKERFPNVQIVVIGLPQGPRGAYRIGMNDRRDTSIQPGGNTVVFVDPASGAVLRSADASIRTSGDTFLALRRSLQTA